MPMLSQKFTISTFIFYIRGYLITGMQEMLMSTLLPHHYEITVYMLHSTAVNAKSNIGSSVTAV